MFKRKSPDDLRIKIAAYREYLLRLAADYEFRSGGEDGGYEYYRLVGTIETYKEAVKLLDIMVGE